MPELEHPLIKRWSAAAFAKAGVALMVLGAAPLLASSLVHPAQDNPVGLAMVAVVLVPVGFLLLGIGALKWLIGRVQRP